MTEGGAPEAAARAGGYWLMGRVPRSPRVAAMLACLPGAALVVPAVLEKGIAGLVALAATAVAMLAGIDTIQPMRQVT